MVILVCVLVVEYRLYAAAYSEDLRRQNDGAEIRRARLFVQGKLWDAWKYKLQYDFTATGSSALPMPMFSMLLCPGR